MILSRLTDSARYNAVHPLFPKAFKWLQSFDPSTPDGRYPISGDDLVAVVQRYETEPDKVWESHRIHADIQFIVSGAERMYVAETSELAGGGGYNEAKDVEKYASAPLDAVASLSLRAGDVVVLFPEDGHKPNCQLAGPSQVLKVVVKVRLA